METCLGLFKTRSRTFLIFLCVGVLSSSSSASIIKIDNDNPTMHGVEVDVVPLASSIDNANDDIDIEEGLRAFRIMDQGQDHDHVRLPRSIVDWDRRANKDHGLAKVSYDLIISELPTSYRVKAKDLDEKPKNFENFYERLNNFAEENDVDDGDAESDLIDEFVEREKRSVDDSASADSTLELELQHAKARRRRQRHQGSNLQNVF